MKLLFRNLFLNLIAILIFTSVSFSNPLHGVYVIGENGPFHTIADATHALDSLGVDGPVQFQLDTGVYNEPIRIGSIPGSSDVNRIIFIAGLDQSHTIINVNPSVVLNNSENVKIVSLSLHDIVFTGTVSNIEITLNRFIGGGVIRDSLGSFNGITISRNDSLHGIKLISFHESSGILITASRLVDPTGFLELVGIRNITLEGVVAGYVSIFGCHYINITHCSFHSDVASSFNIGYSDSTTMKNCFVGSLSFPYTANFHHNSITKILNNSFSTFLPHDTVISISEASGVTVRNNIFVNSDRGPVAVYRDNSGYEGDYNRYSNENHPNMIRLNGVSYTNTFDFFAATGQEQHSTNQRPQFVSNTDLHLHPSESGNELLAGSPDPLVTDDFDGQIRNPVFPYVGADELETALPVELASFTSTVSENRVQLNWSTYSEINNRGFEIQRKKIDGVGEWINSGFVNSTGNINSVTQYEFIDNDLAPGIYRYRLKQIDHNGSFEYYELHNDVLIGLPDHFTLDQNYPNPFNPFTIIKYTIPENGVVSIRVFDISGREVRSLVNKIQDAGTYTVEFDGSGLSSGKYFYELRSGEFRETKSMILIK